MPVRAAAESLEKGSRLRAGVGLGTDGVGNPYPCGQRLQEVSERVGFLKNLRTLDLGHNELTKLRRLNISGRRWYCPPGLTASKQKVVPFIAEFKFLFRGVQPRKYIRRLLFDSSRVE